MNRKSDNEGLFVRLLSKCSSITLHPFFQFTHTHTPDRRQAKYRPCQFMYPKDRQSFGVRCLSLEDAVFEGHVGLEPVPRRRPKIKIKANNPNQGIKW